MEFDTVLTSRRGDWAARNYSSVEKTKNRVVDQATVTSRTARIIMAVMADRRSRAITRAPFRKLTGRAKGSFTLKPRPERGFSLGRSASHRAALIQIRPRRSSNHLTMIEDR